MHVVRPTSAVISSSELNMSLPVNDISDQIREAVLHLQRDLDRVTARVRSLEVSALSGSLHNSLVSDYIRTETLVLPMWKCCVVTYWVIICTGISKLLMDTLHLLMTEHTN
jgi:hypothetical protein